MRRTRSLLVTLLLAGLTAAGAVQAGRLRPAHPPAAEAGRPASILWLAAHPDDEVLAAPLLARECVVRGAECTFLILTRGELGVCNLPQPCGHELKNIRSGEA